MISGGAGSLRGSDTLSGSGVLCAFSLMVGGLSLPDCSKRLVYASGWSAAFVDI